MNNEPLDQSPLATLLGQEGLDWASSPEEQEEEEDARGNLLRGVLLLLIGLAWTGFVLIAAMSIDADAMTGPDLILTGAAVATPPLLLFLIWLGLRRRPGEAAAVRQLRLGGTLLQTDALLGRLSQAEGRLAATMALFEQRSEAAAAAARAGAEGIAGAAGELDARGTALAERAAELEAATRRSAEALRSLEVETAGDRRTMTESLTTITAQADRLVHTLDDGGRSVERLTGHAETVLLAIESNLRELEESLPAALGDVDERMAATTARMTELRTRADEFKRAAERACQPMEATLHAAGEHASLLDTALTSGNAVLEKQRAEAAELRTALAELQAMLVEMGEHQGATLLERLGNIRRTTAEVVQEARDSIRQMIDDVSRQIGEAGTQALEEAVGQKVNAQIGQIAGIADNAVKSAHRATDHLLRQMMALTDSATQLEDRIRSIADAEAGRNRDYLTERAAQIIGALKDSAIDISKGLNREVTEQDWHAYLKGDKSIFSRRAVRILSGGDLRQVHALYDSEPAFQESVNRYIADFEEMLADVLSGRNGNNLAITLLSSDVGKLYVALAQAIERLRVA